MSRKPTRHGPPAGTRHGGKPARRRPRGPRPGDDRVGPAPRDDGHAEGGHSRGHSDKRKDWIYGRHAVLAALANPARRPHRLVLTREAEDALAETGISPPIAPEIRTAGEITALLPEGAVHQGFALAAAPLPAPALEDVIAGLAGAENALVAVLDQVTDPGNVGAILRSAAAFGAAAVILPERHGAETTAALAKAASGALETVALVRVTNVSRALEALKAAGFWCVALEAGAPKVLAGVDLSGRIALVLGSEGAGLRRLVAETCDIHARLPIGTAIESLNVSVAAAIAMYEVARRRG